jgi:manganese transport protein
VPRRRMPRWALYLVGPGLFSAAAGFEFSNLGVFALAGIRYGTSMLWAIALSIIVASIMQQMAAVVGLRVREGLWEKISRRFSSLSIAVAWSLYTANMATAVMNMAGLAVFLSVFTGADWRLSLMLVMLVLWSISYSAGSYRRVEGILTALSMLLLVFVAAAVLSSPYTLSEILKGLRISWGSGDPFFLLAVFGASAAPYSLVLQAEAAAADEERGGEAEVLNAGVGMLFSIIIGISVAVSSPILTGRCAALRCLAEPKAVGLPTASMIMLGILASGILAVMAIVIVNSTLMNSSLRAVLGTPSYLASSGITLGSAYLAALAMLSLWDLSRIVETASIAVSATAWVPALAVYMVYREEVRGVPSLIGALSVAMAAAINLVALASL